MTATDLDKMMTSSAKGPEHAAGPDTAAFLRKARRAGLVASAFAIALAALLSGGPAALGCLGGLLMSWTGIELIARMLGSLLDSGATAPSAARLSSIAFVLRHAVAAALAFFFLLVLHVPAPWVAVGATVWPLVLAGVALRRNALGGEQPQLKNSEG